MEPPGLSAAVSAAISAPFLTPDEAKDLRIFHGVATENDIDSPARRARWALVRGAYLEDGLTSPDAPVLDRAEAMLHRGELEPLLKLIEQESSMRAVRLRVEAYHQLGRRDIAMASASPAVEYLQGAAEQQNSALDVADAVRAAAIAARLRGAVGQPGETHKALMVSLKRAREQLDLLAWPVMLAEAQLLYDKDNSPKAGEAVKQVLSLNPRCAEAWALVGRMSVDAFDMGAAEAVAARLDVVAGATLEDADGAAAAEFKGQAPSPLAAMVRIRAMLRQSDPDLADGLSTGAMRAYPLSRGLLQLGCAITALRFDPADLEKDLAGYERLSPGSGAALYEAGRALSEARQYGAAAELLKRAARLEPFWPQPLIDLGLLYIQTGQDEDAGDTLQIACELDPFNVRADNSLKLVREVATFQRVESEHFIVRFKGAPGGPPGLAPEPSGAAPTSDDGVLAREMLPVLEENHRRVTGAPEQVEYGLDYQPPVRTIIDLMPNHRAFAVRIAGMPRIHTIAASTGPVIAMEAPRDGASHSGTWDWPRVLRHEYVHTVGLGKTNNRLPHWFTEAQAVHLEQAPRDEQTCRLLARTYEAGELFDFVEINAAFVRPKKPTDRQLAYAQGHWMYEYIVTTWGQRAPLKLMDLYAAGVREDQAYREVLGVSREEFMTRFKAWAGEQLAAWGLRARPGEPGRKQILAEARKRLLAAAGPDHDEVVGGDDAEGPEGERGGDSGKQLDVSDSVMESLLADYPAQPDVLELAVTRAMVKNNNTPTLEMAPLLERYAAARPIDPEPHRSLARLYLSLAEPPATEAGPSPRDAIPHLVWLDAREDKTPTYAAQLSSLYVQYGELDKAWAKAVRATQMAPYEARYRERAAAVALQRKDGDSARRQIEAMIVLEPDRAIHRQRLDAVKKRFPQ